MHLGRGRGSAYPECITHIGAKRIGINRSCVVSHRGALRNAETLRGLGPRISACVGRGRSSLDPSTSTPPLEEHIKSPVKSTRVWGSAGPESE